MNTLLTFVSRRPLLTYFTLVFVISWGGGLWVLGPGALPATFEQLTAAGPVLYAAMLAGPTVAGLLMISLVSGRSGRRELLAHVTTWRVGVRWYAAVLLAVPFLVIAVALALAAFSPDPRPTLHQQIA